jgi:hypothetical protein
MKVKDLIIKLQELKNQDMEVVAQVQDDESNKLYYRKVTALWQQPMIPFVDTELEVDYTWLPPFQEPTRTEITVMII